MELPREVQITFEEDGCTNTEGLLVTPVSANLYRVEESSLCGEVSYHDVIEAESLADGGLRFIRVVKPSGLTTVSWALSAEAQRRIEQGTPLLDKVMAVGGNWERVFGGVLILHLPPAVAEQILAEFDAVLKAD